MPQEEKSYRFSYLLAFILVILFINTIRSTLEVRRSAGRIGEAKFQLEELKVENKRLKSDISYAQTPEYLQKAAVEELNMAKPGETILIVEQLKPKSGEKPETDKDTAASKPTPLELWMTDFNLQDVYFNWQNGGF